jgi:hypothetical protein
LERRVARRRFVLIRGILPASAIFAQQAAEIRRHWPQNCGLSEDGASVQ